MVECALRMAFWQNVSKCFNRTNRLRSTVNTNHKKLHKIYIGQLVQYKKPSISILLVHLLASAFLAPPPSPSPASSFSIKITNQEFRFYYSLLVQMSGWVDVQSKSKYLIRQFTMFVNVCFGVFFWRCEEFWIDWKSHVYEALDFNWTELASRVVDECACACVCVRFKNLREDLLPLYNVRRCITMIEKRYFWERKQKTTHTHINTNGKRLLTCLTFNRDLLTLSSFHISQKRFMK